MTGTGSGSGSPADWWPAAARRTVAVAAVASLLAVAGASVGSASAAPADPLAGLDYVALGDSYSAGYGLTPVTDLPVPGCFQAEDNFPHLVARDLGLSLTDATCSGAVTANLTTTPQQTSNGTAPAQNSALSTEADIVTVTIGGNDLGFGDIISFCTALTATGPIAGNVTLPDCRSHYNPTPDVDLLAEHLAATVEPAIAAAFADITAKAPNAELFVVGYPALVPSAATTPPDGCFTSALGDGRPPFPENAFPFTDADVPYLYAVQSELEAAIARQAASVDAVFVSTLDDSEAHSACAPPGEAYINGITLTRSAAAVPDPADQADTPTLLGLSAEPGAMHPNQAGVDFLRDQVVTALREAFPEAEPTPSEAPSPGLGAPFGHADPVIWAVIGAVTTLAAGAVLLVAWRRQHPER